MDDEKEVSDLYRDIEVFEALSEFGIPCDRCGEIQCDGFCDEEEETPSLP